MTAREQWKRRVARWERSGLSRGEFAEREGVKATTLGWWRWALQQEAAPQMSFVEVTDQPTTAALERIEVQLSNGRVVRVPAMFDDALLRRVLAAAEQP